MRPSQRTREYLQSAQLKHFTRQIYDTHHESKALRLATWPRPWQKIEIDERTLLRTLFIMTTITATSARNKLYKLIDEANDSHIPIQITGKRGNAVLVSESDWRAISETIHLSAIPGMVDSIKKGMKEKIEDCSETLEW